jgi:hypothetical protein
LNKGAVDVGPQFLWDRKKRKKDVRSKKEICGICGFLYPIPVQIITHKLRFSSPYHDALSLVIMVL